MYISIKHIENKSINQYKIMRANLKFTLLLLICVLLLSDSFVETRRKRKRRRKKGRKVTIKTSGIIDVETVSINAEARRPVNTGSKGKKNSHSRTRLSHQRYKKQKTNHYYKNKSKGKKKYNNSRQRSDQKTSEGVRIKPITDENHKFYYDSYVLAVQWAKSICSAKRCVYNTNKGKVFNLHGLWPNSSRRG